MKDTKSAFSQQTSDTPRTNGSSETDAQAVAEQPVASEQQATQGASAQPKPDENAEAQNKIKELEDKVAQYLDQLMRNEAELQNYKKRTEREIAQIRSYANERFATELLGIKDSLEMGLQHDAATDAQKLREGIELTLKLLQQAFDKFGIQEINPEGEVFNPELHQAMMIQADESKAPNTVLEVLQKGYSMNDRLLRAAMVCVSSVATAAQTSEPTETAKQVVEGQSKNVENSELS